METPATLLAMNNITKRFPGVTALSGVPFTLKHGEIHALVGENGAGKSTLIKVLTGVERRDGGSILLNGKEIFPQSPQEAQAAGISTVYQEVNLCPNLSVAENIYIGREPRKNGRIDWKAMYKKAEELLSRFDLTLDVRKTLDTYSIAVQQMVAIVRSVDISAKVLILDEPTSSLTSVEVEKLFDVMRMLKARGMGIIFVTHFLDQVYRVCDTITVLRNGGYVGTFEAANLSRAQLVAKMIGREYEELDRNAAEAISGQEQKEPLLVLAGAGNSETIDSVEIKVRRGEVLGLSGLLGSGRSEIVRLIFGIDPMAHGEMRLKGKSTKIRTPLHAIRHGFGFCPENRKTEGVIEALSVRENIILALQAKRGMGRTIKRAEAERLCREYIEKLNIKTPSQDQAVKNLSGGNQQKVILARWLATAPDLMMLDEPTRGIDIGAKAEIQKMVMALSKQDMALIFISSEIDEMVRCCSRIAVLRDQKKVTELSGGEISENAIMKHIAGGGGA